MKSRVPTVCLVYTPCLQLEDDRLEAPLGLLYLGSIAQAKGYPVQIVDLSARAEGDLASLVPSSFDVFGFSCYSVNYGVTRSLARAVRKNNPKAILLAGGPHASALPEEVAADGFDVVVVGEGEDAIVKIIDGIAAGRPLPGRASGPGRIMATEPPDVASLPHPDYRLINVSSYTRQVNGQRCLSILSSRGCPYHCSFCNSTIMGAGRPVRFRPAEDVAAEIREVKTAYGIHHFRFQDDCFAINLRRITELASLLAREEIQYRCFSRVDTCSADTVRLLAASGCVHTSFGVETGSPRLLARSAMSKGQTPAQIAAALVRAHEAGIRTRIFLMVGFPGETDETIEETLRLVKGLPWDEFSVYPLIAYPGTELYRTPERFGITHIDRDFSRYLQIGRNQQAGFTIRTREFDEEQVRRWRDHVRAELLADGRVWAGSSPGFR